jgi:hypothetical protein
MFPNIEAIFDNLDAPKILNLDAFAKVCHCYNNFGKKGSKDWEQCEESPVEVTSAQEFNSCINVTSNVSCYEDHREDEEEKKTAAVFKLRILPA